MSKTQTKKRDSLVTRQILMDLGARLKAANASGSLKQQANALDYIFYKLVELGIDPDGNFCDPISISLSKSRNGP